MGGTAIKFANGRKLGMVNMLMFCHWVLKGTEKESYNISQKFVEITVLCLPET